MSEIVPEYAGCPWPVDPACLGDTWDSYDEGVKERAVALASSTLARLTAYRVGNCPITIRPVRQGCKGGHPWGGWMGPYMPQNWGGVWTNGGCSGTSQCEVELPGPVGRIDEVRADGALIDPVNYRLDLDGGRFLLVYTGTGDCPFNLDQDLSLSDTEPGTFSVTYLNANPVDSLGAYAAGLLAVEFAKACMGGKCRLPVGVRTIVRDGVTMDIMGGAFPNGLTGIREVDTFITLWNPNALQRGSSVWTPDLPTYRVQGV